MCSASMLEIQLWIGSSQQKIGDKIRVIISYHYIILVKKRVSHDPQRAAVTACHPQRGRTHMKQTVSDGGCHQRMVKILLGHHSMCDQQMLKRDNPKGPNRCHTGKRSAKPQLQLNFDVWFQCPTCGCSSTREVGLIAITVGPHARG